METIIIGVPPLVDTAGNLPSEFIAEIPIIVSDTQSRESIFVEV